jgi:gliding motility-associated-like protein
LIYGIEFSPNGKVLYISNLDKLLQFDITPTTSSAIENSEYQLPTGFSQPASLQLAIDDKIYINSGSVNVINCPNKLGAACGFQPNAIANQSGGGGYGLPKWVYYTDDLPAITSNAISYADSCLGNATQFLIQNTAGISSITWNFGDPSSGVNNTSTSLTPTHLFSTTGTYNIRSIVNFTCGVDTIYKTISIVNCDSIKEDCQLFVPNAFTPNGDGANDNFHPLTICKFEQYEFFIFNRWGGLVFKTSNQTDNWDGSENGVDCSSDVYVYLIKYKFPTQQVKITSGSITLLR